MAAEQLKSQSITNLDNTPIVPNSAAQGAASHFRYIDDFVAATAVGVASTKSIYRLIRIPTGAIPKSLTILTTAALDTGTHALAFDLNIVWADDTRYLPNSIPAPAAGEATIPTTANDGATTTTVAAYSSPNIMFGTINNASASAAYNSGDLIANGSQTNYPLNVITMQPLWQTLGFVDGRGNPDDPGGYFDLMAYISTAAGTGAAGKIYARMGFVGV
jgi:hypothetical protein